MAMSSIMAFTINESFWAKVLSSVMWLLHSTDFCKFSGKGDVVDNVSLKFETKSIFVKFWQICCYLNVHKTFVKFSILINPCQFLIILIGSVYKHNLILLWPFNNIIMGKRSELQKSERRKPKRTPKTMLTITTLKRFIKAIRTSKSKLSQRRKANYHNVEKSWSLLRKSERWKEWKERQKSHFCLIFTF